MTLLGIDISSHQGNIAAAALNGQDFVFIKATGGNWYTNAYLQQQVDTARKAGKLIGFYHYAFEGTVPSNPQAEAKHFVDTVTPLLQPGDWVALDFEEPEARGNLTDWVLVWMGVVEGALGFTPCFYSYPDYLATRGLTDERLRRYPLWYARYYIPYRNTPRPVPPLPWTEYAIWQWSGGSQLPGFDFATDQNIFYGDRNKWLAMGKQGAEVAAQTEALPPFTHAEGFLSPIVDTFNWGETSAGIIVERQVLVYNDKEQRWYRGTWRAETGVQWEVIQ